MAALSLRAMADIPDETANRLMIAHGSRALLRAINNERDKAETLPPVPRSRRRGRREYVSVELRPESGLPLPVQHIINAVAEAFEISAEEMRGPKRAIRIVCARSVAARLIRDRTYADGLPRHSLPLIGRYFRRDHSTMCHALHNFENYAKRFPEVRDVYERLSMGALG